MCKMQFYQMKFCQKQRGVVLVAGLIFLVILTIIGITAMGTTALTERMAQNLRDSSIAFEAAEAALGDGEIWVKNQAAATTVTTTTCSASPCAVWQYGALGTTFYKQPSSWWQANAVAFSSTIPGVYQQPRYVIEQYGFVPYDLSPDSLSKGRGYYYYRVTAWGTGPTGTANSVVQSMFATQFN